VFQVGYGETKVMRPDRPNLATPYLNTQGFKISRILFVQPYIQHLTFATKFILQLPSEEIEGNNTTTREWDTNKRARACLPKSKLMRPTQQVLFGIN
jgi:hypothetical protein